MSDQTAVTELFREIIDRSVPGSKITLRNVYEFPPANVQVTEEHKIVKLILDSNDRVQTLTSSLDKRADEHRNVHLDDEFVKTLPHDLILGLFKDEISPDKTFYAFDNQEIDDSDNMSPDLLIRDVEGHVYCLEVTTTKFNDAEQKFVNKKIKYLDILKKRYGEDGFTFFVISVDNQKIVTDMKIEFPTDSYIFKLLFLGWSIQEKYERLLGIHLYEEEDKMKTINGIKSSIYDMNKISFHIDDPLSCKYLDKSISINTNDHEDIENFVSISVKQTTQDLMKKKEVKRDVIRNVWEKTIDDKWSKGLVDFSSFIQLPIIRPKKIDIRSLRSKLFSKFDRLPIEESVYRQIWYKAFDSEIIDEITEEPIIKETSEEYSSLDSYIRSEAKKDPSEKTRKFNTFNLRKTLDDDDVKSVLAERGLFAKANHKFIRQNILDHRKLKQEKGYSMDLRTRKIDMAIKILKEMLKTVVEEKDNLLKARLKFLDSYLEEMSHDSWNAFKKYSKSELANYLFFIETTFAEINVYSRVHSKSKEMFVTYNRVFGNPIIIHNTGSDKHIFFSILFDKEQLIQESCGFSKIEILGDVFCTEILSTRRFDIEQLVNVNSMFFSLMSNYYDSMNLNISEIEEYAVTDSLILQLLIYFENKEQTCSSISNVRFIYQKLFEQIADPTCVLSKFPDIIRSPLLIFMLQRLKQNIGDMIENPPTRIYSENIKEEDIRDADDNKLDEIYNSSLSTDKFDNLISGFDGRKIETVRELSNEYYFSMLRNKNKQENIHSQMKIFSKIMKEELVLRTVNKDRVEPASLTTEALLEPLDKWKSHEYSRPHIRRLAKTVISIIEGKGMIDSIEAEIYNNLSKNTFEFFSTLKASAEYKDITSDDEFDIKKKNSPRIKTMTGILRMMEELSINEMTKTPFEKVSEIYKTLLDNNKDMIVNLFKKNQVQGTREIFVMNIFSRILINLVESISRTLCKLMPNEYLSKGNIKFDHVRDHFSKVFRSSKTEDTNRYDCSYSGDATTWCQRYVMPIFGFFLKDILEVIAPSLVKPVLLILDLVTSKKLELPYELLKLFTDNPEVLSATDENLNELKSQFLGGSVYNDLINSNSKFLKNRSNMMQGVLHFTSSLIHSASMLWLTKFSKSFFNEKYKETGCQLYITTAVTSDDSGILASIVVPKEVDDIQLKKRIDFFYTLLKMFYINSYTLFGMKSSLEKSTYQSYKGVYEFNSHWFVGNNSINPTIKGSIASAEIRLEENTISRMQTDHGLVQSLKSDGATTHHCNNVKIVQLINHYKCIGLLLQHKSSWAFITEKLMRLKHPIAGFYLIGNQFTSVFRTIDSAMIENILKFASTKRLDIISAKSKFITEDNIVTENYSYSLNMGSKRKYFNFLRDNDIDIADIESDIEKNMPDYFTNNITQIKSIRLKSISSGIDRGFRSYATAYATIPSCYILSTNCITIRRNDKIFKCNLPFMFKELEDQIRKIPLSVDLNEDETSRIRIRKRLADDMIYKSLIPEEANVVLFSNNFRKALCTIRFPDYSLANNMTLYDFLMYYWYNKKSHFSRTTYDIAKNVFLEKYPWIKLSLEDSYKEFKSYFGTLTTRTAFLSFIKQEMVKKPFFSYLSKTSQKRNPFLTIRSVVCLDYMNNRIVKCNRIMRSEDNNIDDAKKPELPVRYSYLDSTGVSFVDSIENFVFKCPNIILAPMDMFANGDVSALQAVQSLVSQDPNLSEINFSSISLGLYNKNFLYSKSIFLIAAVNEIWNRGDRRKSKITLTSEEDINIFREALKFTKNYYHQWSDTDNKKIHILCGPLTMTIEYNEANEAVKITVNSIAILQKNLYYLRKILSSNKLSILKTKNRFRFSIFHTAEELFIGYNHSGTPVEQIENYNILPNKIEVLVGITKNSFFVTSSVDTGICYLDNITSRQFWGFKSVRFDVREAPSETQQKIDDVWKWFYEGGDLADKIDNGDDNFTEEEIQKLDEEEILLEVSKDLTNKWINSEKASFDDFILLLCKPSIFSKNLVDGFVKRASRLGKWDRTRINKTQDEAEKINQEFEEANYDDFEFDPDYVPFKDVDQDATIKKIFGDFDRIAEVINIDAGMTFEMEEEEMNLSQDLIDQLTIYKSSLQITRDDLLSRNTFWDDVFKDIEDKTKISVSTWSKMGIPDSLFLEFPDERKMLSQNITEIFKEYELSMTSTFKTEIHKSAMDLFLRRRRKNL